MALFVRTIRALPQGVRRAIWRQLVDDDAADEDCLPHLLKLTPRTHADLRASRLLLRVLTPEQRKQLVRRGYFTVQVRGRGILRIMPNTTFNVVDTKTGARYCAGPEGVVPLADWMLAQKLVLENDPERFFRVARCRPAE